MSEINEIGENQNRATKRYICAPELRKRLWRFLHLFFRFILLLDLRIKREKGKARDQRALLLLLIGIGIGIKNNLQNNIP